MLNPTEVSRNYLDLADRLTTVTTERDAALGYLRTCAALAWIHEHEVCDDDCDTKALAVGVRDLLAKFPKDRP